MLRVTVHNAASNKGTSPNLKLSLYLFGRIASFKSFLFKIITRHDVSFLLFEIFAKGKNSVLTY